MAQSQAQPCGTCRKDVVYTDKGLLCEGMCEQWFHTVCVAISDERYAELQLDGETKWRCPTCDREPLLSLFNDLKSLQASIYSISAKASQSTIESISSELKDFVCRISLMNNLFSESIKETASCDLVKEKKYVEETSLVKSDKDNKSKLRKNRSLKVSKCKKELIFKSKSSGEESNDLLAASFATHFMASKNFDQLSKSPTDFQYSLIISSTPDVFDELDTHSKEVPSLDSPYLEQTSRSLSDHQSNRQKSMSSSLPNKHTSMPQGLPNEENSLSASLPNDHTSMLQGLPNEETSRSSMAPAHSNELTPNEYVSPTHSNELTSMSPVNLIDESSNEQSLSPAHSNAQSSSPAHSIEQSSSPAHSNAQSSSPAHSIEQSLSPAHSNAQSSSPAHSNAQSSSPAHSIEQSLSPAHSNELTSMSPVNLIDESSNEQLSSPTDSNEQAAVALEHEVEDILDYKVVDNKPLFLVKWRNCGMESSSWESREYLANCSEAIDKYFRRSLENFERSSINNLQQ